MKNIARLTLIVFGLMAYCRIAYADSSLHEAKQTKQEKQDPKKKPHNKKTSSCIPGYRGCYGSVEGGT